MLGAHLNSDRDRLESILGKVVPFDEQPLPGVERTPGTEVLYFADDGSRNLYQQFDRITGAVSPPIPKDGGATTTKHTLELPDGQLFHALKFRGDIEGWRLQIVEGARLLGTPLGRIEDGAAFVTFDGVRVPLSHCKHGRILEKSRRGGSDA
jgi:hypothetical protein